MINAEHSCCGKNSISTMVIKDDDFWNIVLKTAYPTDPEKIKKIKKDRKREKEEKEEKKKIEELFDLQGRKCGKQSLDDPTYVCPNKADWKREHFLKSDYLCDYHLNSYRLINKSDWTAIVKNNNNNTFINN